MSFCLVPFLLWHFSGTFADVIHDRRLYSIGREEYDTFAEHFLLPEDFDLATKTPTKRPSPVELDAIMNNELFEGDIMGIETHPNQVLLFNDDYELAEADIFRRPHYSSLNTQTYADKLWRDGRVPYMLEEGMNPSQRAAIAAAFDEYKGKTCIRFVPRESEEPDYIYIKRNHAFGCSSYVGRAGGNQTVSLEVDKCFSKGIIAHELMHAIGFFHEHSRTDRDEFVEILEENVRPGMLRNFEKYPRKIIDPLGMPYDYESVMHYHKLAFSRNGRSTIVPKKRDAEIGQRFMGFWQNEHLLFQINKLYHCDDEPSTTSSTTTTQSSITTTTMTESTTTTPEEEQTQTTAGIEIITEAETTAVPSTETPSTEPSPVESSTDAEESSSSTDTVESTTESGSSSTDDGGDQQIVRAGMRPKERERGGWPRKFITLSIWSVRGGNGHKSAKGGGLSRIREKGEKASRKVERECVDLNAHCEMWERLGHCVHSAKYMRHYCRKSCGLCDKDERSEQESSRLTCTDRNHFCSYWARNGECDNGSKFMKLFCKRSCGLC